MTQVATTPSDFPAMSNEMAERASVVVEIAQAEDRARQGMNTSGITPTEYNVLVRMDPVSKTTTGGIILPDEHADRAAQRDIEVTIAAVPPMAFDTWPEGIAKPAPGERAIITRHAGLEVLGRDGETYRIISDKDVRAILEEKA